MRTLKQILAVLALLAVIGAASFYAYRFFRPASGSSASASASSPSNGTAPLAGSEGSASDAADSPAAVADSVCDSVPLVVSRDGTFAGTSVTQGDKGDIVGQFELYNTTSCAISLSKFSFLLNAPAGATTLSGARLDIDGAPFARALALAAGAGTMAFDGGTSAVTVPPFGEMTVTVIGDVSDYATIGQSFSLQLSGMNGVNKFTHAPYAWSYAATHMRVESNSFDII